MYIDGKVWIGNNDQGERISIIPKMVNRHGLVAGATGTGKTVTLKVMAETFSDMGIPVFMADVKGDIAGMMNPGTDSEDMQKRIEKFNLTDAGFAYKGYPVILWDIYGVKGIQLRTTISEMGPMLLARILDLNDLQSDILTVIFKIADDRKWFLIDTKDLKSVLNYVSDHRGLFEGEYGKMSPASISTIVRAVVALEAAGGDVFFGEPALRISDWLTLGDGGKGMINILDSESLINNGKMYSAFLLWMLSELFETLPEVVKLIRSKGVGVYFCTQNPKDIPDGVLAQLGNKVQHGLHAYTPSDQKAVKAAAMSFRANPAFDTEETLTSLGTGKAVVSFLGEDGIPGMAQKVSVLPPQCSMGSIGDGQREQSVKSSLFYSKYAEGYDPESAYEILMRLGQEEQAREEQAAAEAAQVKEDARLAKEQAKADEKAAREAEKESAAKNRAIKSVGNSVLGTIGRAAGRSIGGSVGGSLGRNVGGNLGASLVRGLLGTFFKR